MFNNLISQYKIKEDIYYSQNIKILALKNTLYYTNNNSMLYVFIDGDGTPWKTPHKISLNPDPINPLVLKLMTNTPNPSIYLSRPCYWERNIHCNYLWWTNRRYSKQVVDIMVKVLKKISSKYKNITLVGYSGGGTLAALIANSVIKVSKLITLSGNLNHVKWTQYHNFSPLTESLNSFNFVLPSTLTQFHFAAENDKIILSTWIKEFSDKQINSRYILMNNFDHRCCWVEKWGEILELTNTKKGTEPELSP